MTVIPWPTNFDQNNKARVKPRKAFSLLERIGLPVAASLIAGGVISVGLMRAHNNNITDQKKQAHALVEEMKLDLQDMSEKSHGDKKTHVISSTNAGMQQDDLKSMINRAKTLNASAVIDESDALMAARYLSAARKVFVPESDGLKANMAGQLVVLLNRIPNAVAQDPSLLP